MKRNKILTILICAVLSFALSITYGQFKEIGKFTAGGVNDAAKLTEAYLTPWANALGTSLSGGWYNTAKAHKLGGFDLTFTFNMGFVPKSDKTFDLDNLNLEAEYDANDHMAPSAAGKNESGPELRYLGGLVGYETPKGTGLSFIPTPMAQIGVGLVKGTEVIGRYLPEVKIGKGGSVSLWGVGLKHDVLQWLPLAKRVPALNVSILGGYTKLNANAGISVNPTTLGLSDATTDAVDFTTQAVDMTVTSFTGNLLVSVNLPVISFYGGAGFATTNTELGLKGYYPIPDATGTVTDASVGDPDPISMNIKNNDGSPTKPRFNIGLRLKLGIITIHGDYTKANYSNVTAGLGISFR
ncbi:MAG: hypothetical protein JXB00_12295 [Bacteroidales bacterium]|nr:hypothetical protein [Bacteroidales bacterium]